MSTVRDSEGNVLNQQADYVARHKYTGPDTNQIDWFDTHPEDKPSVTKVVVEDEQPVAVVPDVETNKAIEQIAATLPTVEIVNNGDGTSTMTPSAADLDAVAAEQEIAQATEKEESNVQSSNPSIEADNGSHGPSESPSTDVLGG